MSWWLPLPSVTLRRFESEDGAVLHLERVKEPGRLPRYVVWVDIGDGSEAVLFDSEGRFRAEDVWWHHREALKPERVTEARPAPP